MYILTIKEKGAYSAQTYTFDNFQDMVTFAEVALKNAVDKMEATIEIAEKEGEPNEI